MLYASGALSLYHRARNAGSLTVVMFHRTLSPGDPRWATCDPDYTLSRDVFARSLAFFRRHYNVVSLEQVLQARRSGAPLPPRAMLLTFDDGWADNVDHALPELRKAGMPALMFVVADAVGRRQPFWQERLIAAWRRGTVGVREIAARMPDADTEENGGADGMPALRRLIARLEGLPAPEREDVLAPFEAALDDGLQHMVDARQLLALRDGGVALGLHGKSHVRMTEATDLDAQLDGARQALAASLAQASGAAEAPPTTLSFPHGAHDAQIAGKARDAGYELLFTSVPVLNPARARPGWLLGRTGFETDAVVDGTGRFRPDWLAWYLFRREARVLA